MKTFSEKVLEIVKKIPEGKVITYKAIADKLRTKSYRAVGQALRNNNTPITIPCHRVINSDRTLGGYCGKSKSKKKHDLLKKEGITIKEGKVDPSYILNSI